MNRVSTINPTYVNPGAGTGGGGTSGGGQAPPAPDPRFVATAMGNAKANAPGYGTGSLSTRDSGLFNRSAVRQDQTGLERIAEQRGNFFYGGSAAGAQNAENALRYNMGNYTAGFNNLAAQYGAMSAGAQNRVAPLDYSRYSAQGADAAFSRNAAQHLYQQALQGPGPSAAQAQLDASTAAGMRQQLALAGSGRGAGGGASAFRQAAANQAQMQGAANAQASTLRAQEANAWQQQQASMLSQAAGLAQGQQQQDLAAAGYFTGANQQQTQLNDQAGLGYGQLGLGAMTTGAQTQMGIEQGAHNINTAALSGSTGYEQLLAQIYGIGEGVGVQNDALNAQKDAAMWGAIGTGAAMTAMAVSDIRAKEDVKPISGGIGDMLSKIKQEQGVSPWKMGEHGMEAPIPGFGPSPAEDAAARDAESQRQFERSMRFGQFGGQLGQSLALMSDSREKREFSRENAALKEALSKVAAPSYASASYPDVGARGISAELDRLKSAQDTALQGAPSAAYPTPRQPDTAALDKSASLQAVEQTQPWSYRYKDPARHGEGTHYGPMAQELAQTPVGRSTLTRTPDGRLAVDTGRLALVNTAALSAQQDDNAAIARELDAVKKRMMAKGMWEEPR